MIVWLAEGFHRRCKASLNSESHVANWADGCLVTVRCIYNTPKEKFGFWPGFLSLEYLWTLWLGSSWWRCHWPIRVRKYFSVMLGERLRDCWISSHLGGSIYKPVTFAFRWTNKSIYTGRVHHLREEQFRASIKFREKLQLGCLIIGIEENQERKSSGLVGALRRNSSAVWGFSFNVPTSKNTVVKKTTWVPLTAMLIPTLGTRVWFDCFVLPNVPRFSVKRSSFEWVAGKIRIMPIYGSDWVVWRLCSERGMR